MKRPHELQEVITLTAENTALTEAMVASQLDYLSHWKVDKSEDGFQLRRIYEFPNFLQASRFIYEIGKKIGNTKHLPQIELKEDFVTVKWLSPQTRGLHQLDFIMAATTDEVYEQWDVIIGERDKVDVASEESFPASDPPAVSGDDSKSALSRRTDVSQCTRS